MRKVEIIKLGDILGSEKTKDPYMLIITDGGSIVDYYNEILIRNCKDIFKIQKTSGIVEERMYVIRGKIYNGKSIKGIEDDSPIVGQSYSLNKKSWNTSKVDKIIEDCIIITRNSVYAIHDIQNIRNKKLDDLGI